MMARFLEQFDPAPEPEAPQPTYEQGFAAGVAVGRKEVESSQAMLSTELVAAVAELQLTAEAAEARVIAALAPLFEALTEALLPAVAREAIGLQIVEAILERAGETAAESLSLEVSEQDATAIRAAFAGSHLALDPVPSPRLAPGQAILTTDRSQDFIDFAEVQVAIQNALAALTSPLTGDRTHDI